MSNSIRKTILFGCCSVTSNLGFVGNPNVFFSLRVFASSSNQQSFTVSYLVNEHGFSPDAALCATKRVNFESSEKPDKVINLFKKYGFTRTQISSIFRIKAQLLVADTEKSISPKLEFFDAKGVSWPRFAKNLSQFPSVLARSLDKNLLPSYEFLRNFLRSDEKAIGTVEKYPDILIQDIQKILGRNIDILREHGVPDSNIAKLIPTHPRAFMSSPDRFQEFVEEVVEMGFNPKRINFVQAVLVLLRLSKSTWESKINAYTKWGWSEDEVLKAFKGDPLCMMVSKDKLNKSMDLFTNQMGWRSCLMAKCPVIFKLSLKKRVVPRCWVLEFLMSKGFVEKEAIVPALLKDSEEKFLQKFIAPYEKKAPELLKLYKEKVDLSSEEKSDV